MGIPKIRHVRGGRPTGPRLQHIRNPKARKKIVQEQSAEDHDLGKEKHMTLGEAGAWAEARGGTTDQVRTAVLAGDIYGSDKQGVRYFISPSGLTEWAEDQPWYTPI